MLLEAHSIPNANTQADWAEASCLLGGDTSISRSYFDTALTEFGYDDSELIIGDIWREINWRKNVLPKYYPINVHYGRIERNCSWQDQLAYSFMLLLSTSFFCGRTKITQKEQRVQSKLFERVVTVATKRYLVKSINIGFPREGRMPRSLHKSIKLFCDLSNEAVRQKPEIVHYAKDEGVDVIAWNPLDNRPGQVILLVQSTIERNWPRSTQKINLDAWKNIVNFASTPCKALAFPYVCHSQWKSWSTRGGMLFDRLRLTSLFPMTSTIYLKKKISEWCERQISRLRWFD